jgi:hypothetical protein
MPHAPTPWVGLAALVAMFVLPMLPSWLFEGPRTVKHRPRRHICALCSAPWTSHHDCLAELPEVVPSARGQLRRLDETTTLELGSPRSRLGWWGRRWPRWHAAISNSPGSSPSWTIPSTG